MCLDGGVASGGDWEHQRPAAAGPTHRDQNRRETLPESPRPGRSTGDRMAEETRVIYHLEDQETPYLIRISVPAERVTLADFKQVLNKPNVKFFFKSVDDDFG